MRRGRILQRRPQAAREREVFERSGRRLLAKASSSVGGTFASSNHRCVILLSPTRTMRMPECRASATTGGEPTTFLKSGKGCVAIIDGSSVQLITPPHDELVTTSMPDLEWQTALPW